LTCILCNFDSYHILYEKENFHVVRCDSCGLVYVHPQPSQDRIRRLYNETYYNAWGLKDNLESVERIKKQTCHKRFEEIEKYMPPGKILDNGCATGLSLEVASVRSWEPYGVELSEYSSNIAKKKFGKAVFTGTLEEANFQSNFFNAILMLDLIEHVPNPNRTLSEARRILRHDGLLALTTPDITSLSSRVMRKHWVNIKFEHLFYFSPRTIASILEKNHFRVLKIIPAVKALNLTYFHTQFNVYKMPLVTEAINVVVYIIPKLLKQMCFYASVGDMFVIARKN